MTKETDEGELEETCRCEWCGANWEKGEECNEQQHYLNR